MFPYRMWMEKLTQEKLEMSAEKLVGYKYTNSISNNMSSARTQMTESRCHFISGYNNTRSDRKMSKFQPTGSKNCGVSLPPYIVQHLDSIRGGYPRSKFVLALIKKSLELKEPTGVKLVES